MPAVSKSKYLVQAGWKDVPHIDAITQEELLQATPPYLRDARTKGIPSLGAGAIYPIEMSEILCDPFQIPQYFLRTYALDVGWNRTAVLWGALDRSIDCWYLYTEHYRGKAEPSIHATAIKARGEWIPGLIDPAARGRSQEDGKQLIVTYAKLGLKLEASRNALEAGIYEVWERLSTGRIKIFSTLQNFKAEYRLYRRDEKGNVVSQFDHLMDCMRYIVLSGASRAQAYPVERERLVHQGIGDTKLQF
jgi:hypothetical protein